VVLFDKRLRTARYGREILRALPDVPVFRDLAAIDRFFGRGEPARDRSARPRPGLTPPEVAGLMGEP